MSTDKQKWIEFLTDMGLDFAQNMNARNTIEVSPKHMDNGYGKNLVIVFDEDGKFTQLCPWGE